MSDTTVALPNRADLPWYLASSGLALAAMSLQGFLIPVALGFLSAHRRHAARLQSGADGVAPDHPAAARGIYADRTDGRRMLLWISGTAALVPLVVAATLGHLSYWVVIAFGAAMAALQSAGDPARAAMLNRVTRMDIQRTVTAMTVVTHIHRPRRVLGRRAHRVPRLGQRARDTAALFALSAFAVGRLPPFPPVGAASHLLDGLRALRRTRVLRNVLGINFASSFFNAGAYIVVMPLVVREVYQADAAFLASMMIAFTVGSSGSNALLFLFMPLKHPGRLFLVMQLTPRGRPGGTVVGTAGVVLLRAGVRVGREHGNHLDAGAHNGPGDGAGRAPSEDSLLVARDLPDRKPNLRAHLGFVVDATDAPSGLLPGVLISLCLVFAVASCQAVCGTSSRRVSQAANAPAASNIRAPLAWPSGLEEYEPR